MANSNKRSPVFYIVTGCLVFILVAVLFVVGCGVLAWRGCSGFVEKMADPASRAEAVRETLGAEQLPPGYSPVMAFSVPFLFDMAIISTAPVDPTAEPDLGAIGDAQGETFFFIKYRLVGGDSEAIGRFIRGESQDAGALREALQNVQIDGQQLEFDPSAVFERGRVRSGDAEVSWALTAEGPRGRASSGLTNMLWIDCPGRDARLGFWSGAGAAEPALPDAAAGAEAPPEAGAEPGAEPASGEKGAPGLGGSVGDPKRLEELLSYFDLCL